MSPSIASVGASDGRPRGRVDVKTHVPALVTMLGAKVALHAARLSARNFGLDLTEWRVVQIVGSEGRASIINVAKMISLDPGGVSRAVARLEHRGLIARHDDALDRRKSLVDLTEEGEALYDEISAFALEREERLLEPLSRAERSELRRLLTILTEEIDDMLADGPPTQPVHETTGP